KYQRLSANLRRYNTPVEVPVVYIASILKPLALIGSLVDTSLNFPFGTGILDKYARLKSSGTSLERIYSPIFFCPNSFGWSASKKYPVVSDHDFHTFSATLM